jgi:precorrin-2 dehydrogenase/sirohydrochlorin ferrochelatase
MLMLRDCAVVVIGGGRIATRKVTDLVATGAHVTLISPTLSARLQQWVREGRVRHRARPYRRGDLKGSRLAIAATSDPREQARIAAEARTTATWVNVVDQPTLCDFFAPAVFRRGDLTITVSTDGQSPALARWVKQRLEMAVGPEYARVVSLLAAVRAGLRAIGASPTARRRITDQLMAAGLPTLVHANDRPAITRLIRRVTGLHMLASPARGARTGRRSIRSHRGPSLPPTVR